MTSNGDGFGSYLPEILRGEGLNEFDVADIGSVDPQTLAAHDVVVLGHTSLSDAQVAMFSAWVQGGGNLVAMRPDKKLAGLLGLVGRRRHARRGEPDERRGRRRPARACASTAAPTSTRWPARAPWPRSTAGSPR